jgi:ribosome maturation factor RimP
MITEKQIRSLAESYLSEGPLFLVDLSLKPGNHVNVFIDGDHGVKIEDCRNLSRFLEQNLDREAGDFDLTVSSAGADRPLKLPRQYRKNAGKALDIVTVSGEKIAGIVLEVSETGIAMERQEKQPKRDTDKQRIYLKFEEIASAKEIISLKK